MGRWAHGARMETEAQREEGGEALQGSSEKGRSAKLGRVRRLTALPKPSACHGGARPFTWIVPQTLGSATWHMASHWRNLSDRETETEHCVLLPTSLSWEAVGTGSEPRPGLSSALAVGRLGQVEDLQLRSQRLRANPGSFAFGPALLWPEPRARCQARSWSIRSRRRAPGTRLAHRARPGFRAERRAD